MQMLLAIAGLSLVIAIVMHLIVRNLVIGSIASTVVTAAIAWALLVYHSMHLPTEIAMISLTALVASFLVGVIVHFIRRNRRTRSASSEAKGPSAV